MTATELERIGYRAALSVRCVDAVRGTVVADDMVATAWPADDPAARLVASRSPSPGCWASACCQGSGSCSSRAHPAASRWSGRPTPRPSRTWSGSSTCAAATSRSC